jgi:hypothetical protein
VLESQDHAFQYYSKATFHNYPPISGIYSLQLGKRHVKKKNTNSWLEILPGTDSVGMTGFLTNVFNNAKLRSEK